MSVQENDDLIDFDEYTNQDNDVNQEDNLFDNYSSDLESSDLEDDDFMGKLNNNSNEFDSEILSNLLLQKGITDPSKIQIEDEDGNLTEVDFNSLPLEEKLEILNYENSPELDDLEIETINYLRENNVSLDDLINYHKEQAIKEYLESQQGDYTIDSLSDEELFILDTKSRYEHLSEEEIDQELQKELNNPDIFKKKVEKLRDLYKQQEIEEISKLTEQSELEEKENYESSVNLMVEVAQETNELFDLELEDEDKEEVLQFLLQKDINGQSEFAKLLNDPKKLFEIAWFAIKGKEAFDTVHDYYKKEIDSARKAKGASSLTSRPTVVKKDTKPGKTEDPYGLNEIFK